MPLSYTPPATIQNFQGMISSSPTMFQFFEMLKKAARTDAPVLIRGESGTGKELAARAIHTLSRRAAGPFHAVNCATLTRELAISELFGHVKGAFTGASQNRRGLFEVSHQGSLFLDEIVEIPLDVQPRLLRVLQDHTFTPLGSTLTKTVDVRLISATHESLRQTVEEQRFRADLMYRVRVIPLFLPPLRDRGQDIPMLAHRFLEQLNQQAERQTTRIHPQAMDAMLSYAWPGNIRELRNVMEYAQVMGEGPDLLLRDLTPELRGEAPPGAEDNIKLQERKRILAALNAAEGSRHDAAEQLGMSRATLWRKMREYRLDGR
jgi:two-component system response regulator AtoC